MSRTALLFIPFLCSIPALLVHAQSPEPFVPQITPSIGIKRASGTIDIDGNLDDGGWLDAAHADGFAESYPGDLTRPAVGTKVLLSYDDNYLYVGFICQDDPRQVRAYLHDRDQGRNEDLVGIQIDTYGDADNAVELFANALGVQQGQFILYRSAGRITESGYQVEMAIPFSSLRYPNTGEQNWRINFQRIRPRESRFVYEWAAISRDNTCRLCQFGTLKGLRDIRYDHTLEVLPTVTAGYATESVRGDQLTTEASLTARYVPVPNISAAVSLSPTLGPINKLNNRSLQYFRGIQAEQQLLSGDLNINQSLLGDGTMLFADAVAATFTAHLARTTISYQGGYSEWQSWLFSRYDGAGAGASTHHEVSVRQSLRDDSYMEGAARIIQWVNNGYVSTVQTEGRLRVEDNYLVSWGLGISSTSEPNDTSGSTSTGTFDNGRYTDRFDGEEFTGYSAYADITRAARHWNFGVSYYNSDTRFRTPTSITATGGSESVSGRTSYIFYPDSSIVERITPSLRVNYLFSAEDYVTPSIEANTSLDVVMKNRTTTSLSYSTRTNARTRSNTLSIYLSHEFSDIVTGGTQLGYGRNISNDYSNSYGSYRLWANVAPIRPLYINAYVEYSHQSSSESTYSQTGLVIAGMLANYQMSPQLSGRVEATIIGGHYAYTDINIEPTLLYRLTAYSAVELGYGRQVVEFSDELGSQIRTRQQLYLKVQYLIGG